MKPRDLDLDEIENLFLDRKSVRQALLTVKGKSYSCSCGANVFSGIYNYYKCNGCGSIFEGEGTEEKPLPKMKPMGY